MSHSTGSTAGRGLDTPVTVVPAETYADLVRGSDDAIMAVDLAGRVTVWNAGCERLFGWSDAEVRGQDVGMLLPADRRQEIDRVLAAFDGRPEAAAVETYRVHRSGELLPVACRISPLVDADGRVYGASAVVRDHSGELALRAQLEQARHEAEARFLQSPVAQVTLDGDGVVVSVNPSLVALSGYPAKELLGRSITHFLAEDESDGVTASLSALLPAEPVPGCAPGMTRHTRRLRHADGRLVDCKITVYPVTDPVTGSVERLEAMVEDVSEAVAAQRELTLREARWQSLAANSADVALLADADATLTFVSASAEQRFGYPPSEVLGATGFAFYHPDDEPAVHALWDEVVAEPGASRHFEARIRHADGTWRWVEESLTNRLTDPSIGAVVANITDITDRRSAEAVLRELAGVDSLTGLATRPALLASLDSAFAAGRAARTAAVVVDVARFKLVNDTHGLCVGDQLLAEVAVRLLRATE